MHKKVCISRATVKDFMEVVKNMNDPTPYAKILIHLGTNDLRNDNESTIINNLKHLILLIQQRWETATIIFSGIILHRNDSRKNIKINSISTSIKHELQHLNIEFLDNVNVVTLPSGHIDLDAYFGNLQLNNEKGTKKLANNFKIHLELKSRGERPRNRKFISTRETNLHHSSSRHPYIQTPFTFTGKRENEVFTQIPPISYYHVNQQSRNGYLQYRNNYNRIPNNHRPPFQPRLLIAYLHVLNLKFDCICLSEVWSTNLNSYQSILKDYISFFAEPTDSNVGGVVMFVKNIYKILERKDLKIPFSSKVRVEDLWVEITNKSGENIS